MLRKALQFRSHKQLPKKFVNSLHWRLLNMKLNTFKPKVRFSVDAKNYVIKTADNIDELRKVLKLRYDIFTDEYPVQMRFNNVDFDRFDLLADHILVMDKETDRILATYRVLSSLFTSRFYSQNEFTLQNFLSTPGVKLELGRACVDPHFRTGVCINLVWRGLAKYSELTGTERMFGCATVNTIDPYKAMAIFRHLEEQHFNNEYFIKPTKKYLFDHYPDLVPVGEDVNLLIPSLFKSYLKAGAQLHALPAFDRDFGCTDFFISLDLQKLNSIYFKRYY